MRILFLFILQLAFIATFTATFTTTLHAQTRVINDKGQYIILMPDGSWHPDTPSAAVVTETKPAAEKKDTVKAVSAVLTNIETKIVAAKVAEAVKKDTLKATAIIPAKVAVTQTAIDAPLPTVSTNNRVTAPEREKSELIKKDTVAPAALTAAIVVKAATSETPPTNINIPTAPVIGDTPPTNPSAFATPDDEYMKRIKDAASPALNKQDAAVGGIEVAPKTSSKNTISKKAKSETTRAAPTPKKKISLNCDLQTDIVDEFTGKEKKATKGRTFFSYTPEAAKKYMRADDYLTCTGYLSRVGALKALHLTFTIDSQYGQQEYGEIPDGSNFMVKMIDDSTVDLFIDKGDKGRIDRINNRTIYNVFCIIEPGMEKKLKSGEVSKVRMVWAVGFEDYEVYNLDFFKEQFPCVN